MTETPDSNVPPQESAPPETPPVTPPPTADSNKDERNWGMLCHLAALARFAMPFGGVVGPLIVWLIKKDEFPLVDREGKKALNFQITVSIAILISIPLCLVIVGFFLIPAVLIASLIFTIIASVRTSEGRDYEYPFSIKFFS